jgi:hypothetical protein
MANYSQPEVVESNFQIFRTIDQAVSRLLPTAAAGVRFQVMRYRICNK